MILDFYVKVALKLLKTNDLMCVVLMLTTAYTEMINFRQGNCRISFHKCQKVIMESKLIWKKSSRKELQNKLASVVKIVNFGNKIFENGEFCY